MADVRVVMYLTGQLAVVVVIIDLARQTVRRTDVPSKIHLPMTRVHAAVLAAVTHLLRHILDGVRIVILSICVFPYRRESKTFIQILLILQEGRYIAKRTHLHLSLHMRTRIIGRQQHRLDVHTGRRRHLTGRDEDVLIVAYDQRHAAHIVQRITGKINLTTLAVAQHHPVITHTRMLRSQTSHRHRLHAASTAIVPQRDARQTMQRVRHIRHPQTHHLPVIHHIQGSRRSHHMMFPAIHHLHLVKAMSGRVRLCRQRCRHHT